MEGAFLIQIIKLVPEKIHSAGNSDHSNLGKQYLAKSRASDILIICLADYFIPQKVEEVADKRS